jgi:hypothetical protein
MDLSTKAFPEVFLSGMFFYSKTQRYNYSTLVEQWTKIYKNLTKMWD